MASLLVAVAPLFAPSVAQAQSNLIAQGSGTIEEIRVAGTQRIDPTTVVSYLEVKPGDGFDSSRIDASLKSLFATGLFADVTLRQEGRTLIVQVVENPIINRIAFEGNYRLEADTLNKEVSLRPRVVYTRTKVQSDVQRILELYRRSGRF
ncbi:MAG: outer membrane protein assembly factor BamA, partial [Alphaproteobacteria bacterium]|nr:outer membrane protein assembly factor BamA [Alphaproteobacteria bacterium]